MKSLKIPAMLAVSLATPALAGSPPAPFTVVPEVVAIAPQAADWSGPYVGGMVSFGTGEFDEAYLDTYFYYYDLSNVTQFGGFAGYNFQRGHMVYGVEAAYTTGRMEWSVDSSYAYDWFADVKARVGYAFGDALVYGVVGGSWAGYDDDTTPETHRGYNYGVGVDYRVSDRMFVGVEYLRREVQLEYNINSQYSGSIQSIEARVGLTF